MAVDPRSPCIIGIGRTTYHRGGELAPEPLDMWEEVCRQAASDSGDSGVLAQADHLGVVFCQSWKYDDPTGRLADRLGCREAYQRYSGIGGVVAQALISDAAARMLAGEIELAILVGAEALDTVRRAYAQHIELEWSHSAGPVSLPFDYPPNEAEVSHELHNAYATFAIRDIARRGRLGVPPEHYREQLGSQLARCSTVAAHNPYAWFPTERSAQEIISPAPTNRMVAYPYTKYMTAVLEVDMAAAVILATEQRANELGIRRDGRIYLRSWSQADDPPYVAQHPDLWRSPAAAATSAEAIRLAGIRSLDEVDLFDLYSCFSASINFSRDAIGLELNDPRAVTVTGGLPYHGGPSSNYMMHGVAEMVSRLREGPEQRGLITGVGMHLSKHSTAVYSATPGHVVAPRDLQATLNAQPASMIVGPTEGPATLAAYTVVHGRDGTKRAIAICDVGPRVRCYAESRDLDLLEALEAEEWVNRPIVVSSANGQRNEFRPARRVGG